MDDAIYSFFRNARSFFGIPHRLDKPDDQQRNKALRLPSPDLYDDTSYATSDSYVEEYENQNASKNSQDSNDNNHPRFRRPRFGFDKFYSNKPFGNRQDENEGIEDPMNSHDYDPFGFSMVFGSFDKFFNEMEKEFADMRNQFGFGFNDDGNRFQEFGIFDEPIVDRNDNKITDNDNQDIETNKSIVPYNAPNLRDQILKPSGGENDSEADAEVITQDSDGDRSIQDPGSIFNWRSSSSTFGRTFSSSPEGSFSQAYSKTIRDTPEGREITTFKQNKDGTMEKSTEFIPRKDLPANSAQTGIVKPFGFFGDFFKPRM